MCLSLIKNQGVGTSLEGDETDIRRLFIDLLFTNDHSKIVYELCINNDGIQRNLDVSFELITVIENEFRFRYVDRDRISIVLSFLLNRLGLMKTKIRQFKVQTWKESILSCLRKFRIVMIKNILVRSY